MRHGIPRLLQRPERVGRRPASIREPDARAAAIRPERPKIALDVDQGGVDAELRR